MALSDEKLSLVTIIVTFVLCMFWLTMTDSEFARKNTQAEGEMLERSFGTETAMAITNQADIWGSSSKPPSLSDGGSSFV